MIVAELLIGLIALLHVYFLVLEMFFWTKPYGLKVLRQSLEKAEASKALAANQGLYNGFLATGLIWSLAYPIRDIGLQIALFFLGCIIAAGIYGGYSVNKRIFFIQGGPAILAFVLAAYLRWC